MEQENTGMGDVGKVATCVSRIIEKDRVDRRYEGIGDVSSFNPIYNA